METIPEPDGDYYSSLLIISLLSIPASNGSIIGLVVGVLVVILLIIGSALISGSEVALFGLSSGTIEEMNQSNVKSDIRAAKLLRSPNILLATILIANNLFNIAFILFVNYVVRKYLPDSGENEAIHTLMIISGTAIILVLFGEVLPKIYATRYARRFAQISSSLLSFLYRILFPVSVLLNRSFSFIQNRIDKKQKEIDYDELNQAIDMVADQQTTVQDLDRLRGIIKFGNIMAKQIMRARVDIIAIEDNSGFKDICSLVIESGFSRIPVYHESIDEVKGIIYAKDLIEFIDEDDLFNWQLLLRPVFYVPEMKKIDDLLQDFQQKRVHLAIVVDEYGGTSGLITLEDVLEEVVGEISDEFDQDDEIQFRKINDNICFFEGKTQLNDVYKVMDIKTEVFEEVKGESESLAGLILELNGSFPEKNEVILHENYKFTVLNNDENRIGKIKLEILKQD